MAVVASFPVIDLQRTGRSIEARRKEAGLSVRQLQDYFGFEYPQAIYKWQHGECLPTVDNLLALSRLLRVSMEDLLVYEDQEVHFFWPGIFSTRMLVKLLPPPGKELFWKMRKTVRNGKPGNIREGAVFSWNPGYDLCIMALERRQARSSKTTVILVNGKSFRKQV